MRVFMIENETFIKEYQPDSLYSYDSAYPIMCYVEYENVSLIGQYCEHIEQGDIAQESDVEKYSKLHFEFELIPG